jgi:hypothetical protein
VTLTGISRRLPRHSRRPCFNFQFLRNLLSTKLLSGLFNNVPRIDALDGGIIYELEGQLQGSGSGQSKCGGTCLS